MSLPGKPYRREELAHLELDEVHQFRVVHRVDLVQGDDHVRHVDLLGEQHVLARLRHRAVDRADDEDGAVHLRRAGDHVLDVVGVARAVDVRVVPVRGRVLDVAGRDRQDLRRVATALRLGRLRDFVVRNELRPALVGRDLGERGGQGGLAMVDVADGANVDVGFGTIEFLFVFSCSFTASRCGFPSVARFIAVARRPLFARSVYVFQSLAWLAIEARRLDPWRAKMEPMTRIELVTSSLPRTCSAN